MAEYIEREATYTIAKKICNAIRNGEYHPAVFAYDIMDWIDDVPAADVVPVVRCKDCKYNLANIPDIQDGMNINENWNACQLTELYDSVDPMDFCSHGAKMDGEA